MYNKLLKRVFDLVAALVFFILTLPVLITVYVVLFVTLKGNPFFFQERPGRRERKFKIIKFKTMTDETDETGVLLDDNIRLTRFGSLIRKLSIDELPQLINILKGNMSLIGPRPLLFKYMHLYSPEQRRRHEVRPGITGWAQVNGRNSISWSRKFELDVYYVDNVSFVFDLKILWLTFLKVIKTEGVNQTENRPMLPFDGTN